MPRIPRIVIPGVPYHIAQRGNRRQQVFFEKNDYLFYLHLLKKHGTEAGVQFWAYCLMPNHVHFIAVPGRPDSLTKAMSVADRKYAQAINLRHDWTGCLWQGRFFSCPLDHAHLLAATRYTERNPVRSGLVSAPIDYPWSSAHAHVRNSPDPLISDSPLMEEIKDWRAFVGQEEDEKSLRQLREYTSTGRPLGDDAFLKQLEKISGRQLTRKKPGRKSGNGVTGTDFGGGKSGNEVTVTDLFGRMAAP
jgi:putative transposase